MFGTAFCCFSAATVAVAQETKGPPDTSAVDAFAALPALDTKPAQRWNAFGQFTLVAQHRGRFNSPSAGENSLYLGRSTKETTDLTAYLGAKLWPGGELYLNPEIDQGSGLSTTVVVAGFPSGEAYKVGRSQPYFRLSRAFVRHVEDLSGAPVRVESVANALEGNKTENNLAVTLGKFSVVDVFDNNSYAHDPRSDFFKLERHRRWRLRLRR